MNDTTFHSLSLFPKRTRARKKCRGWSQKTQARGSFLTTRARECALFFSLFSRRISSNAARRDDSIVVAESKSEEAKFQTTTLYTKRTFFILDLRFHVIDGIRRLHFQGDGFARQGFHENLHLLLLRLV